MFKHRLPSFIRLMIPFVTWKVKTNDKIVYLTFDDGPHPTITPWVLNELMKAKAKATFFCVGDNVVKHPHILNLTQQHGHTLGNHTMHHQNGWKLSTKEYLQEVGECANVLPTKLFRPPYGRITISQAHALKKLGYKIIMWDVLTCDYEQNLNIEQTLSSCKKLIKNGSIIVMHDSEKAEKNMKQILPELLSWLSQNDFSCEVL